MHPAKLLISGASPDELNINSQLRNHVARAFEPFLGPGGIRNVPYEYAAETILSFAPDLALIFGSIMPDTCDYTAIERAAQSAGAHLAFWLHDDPYEFDFCFKAIESADTIFTNDRWAAQHYDFPRVFHLPMAACEQTHYRDISKHASKSNDLFFAGVGFDNRIRIMRDLASALKSYRTCIRGSGWPTDLPGCRNLFIPNEALADYYVRSWVVLNLGRDFDLGNERYRLPPTTPGPRTFEAAMAGCVQLYFVTGLEIEDYFAPESEILLFDHASEVPAILDSVLSDPDKALAIGRAAQKRALRDHTYTARARSILKACFPEWEPHSSKVSESALA
jgi:spore maturation protein CgeB